MHHDLWKALAPGNPGKQAPPAWFPGTHTQYSLYCRRVAGTKKVLQNPLLDSLYRYRHSSQGEIDKTAVLIEEAADNTIAEVNSHTSSELDARFGPAPSLGETAAQVIARCKMQIQAVKSLEVQRREEKNTAAKEKKEEAAAKKAEAAAEREAKRRRTN